ncbi:DUF3025 domain-containing protein [Pseudoalteromonas sp. KAN5]|uniref:DUF3025 domain-containing protein n=1 Tax=Pseudoalteromonas sp. KAN5 TaxID=2916633 RepID=UPI001FCBC4F1|nr:DUF3025 domain-containing protein [Pseudoalteromonas sp. KAN5]BDF94397.1 hypothetical protein KAN5_12350 [Pseudoalteromonas sp. KAN5]
MKRFTPHEQWHSASLESGAFNHLNTLFALQCLPDWPACAWFSSFLDAKNANQQVIRFVDDACFSEEERYYEQIIFDTGKVPTRQQNWHDLFGGLIWCLFPKTKALINQRHVEEIAIHGTKQRSKHRNALTLFDECGVVLAVCDDVWPQLLKNHQWQDAFVKHRALWGKTITPFMFGHANYEMLTKPYIGLTGKALFVKVPNDIFCKDLTQQYQYIDQTLYEMIKHDNCLRDNSQLSPLPLLGVPGWYDNNNPEFYSNTGYFRPKRRIRT